jgi:hypothetical protein
MKITRVAAFFITSLVSAGSAAAEVIIHCGGSQGTSYFFYDELFYPEGPGWEDDGITNGRIILVREGDEWDILFGDIAGQLRLSAGWGTGGARYERMSVLVVHGRQSP